MASRYLTPETRSCSNADLARKLRGEVPSQEPVSNLVAEALARILERIPDRKPLGEREKAKLASQPVEELVLSGADQYLGEDRRTLDKPYRPFAQK